MKKVIRLTESDLHSLIQEAINGMIGYRDYAHFAGKGPYEDEYYDDMSDEEYDELRRQAEYEEGERDEYYDRLGREMRHPELRENIQSIVRNVVNEISGFQRGAAAGARKAQMHNLYKHPMDNTYDRDEMNKRFDKYYNTKENAVNLTNRDMWKMQDDGKYNEADNEKRGFYDGMKYGYNKYKTVNNGKGPYDE